MTKHDRLIGIICAELHRTGGYLSTPAMRKLTGEQRIANTIAYEMNRMPGDRRIKPLRRGVYALPDYEGPRPEYEAEQRGQ